MSNPFGSNRGNIQYEDYDDETEVAESDTHGYQHLNGEASVHDSTMSTLMFKDCTENVHHMHNLLLYLLSNPFEFQEAIDFYNNKSTTSTLSAFHAEYDRATDVGSVFNGDENVPVPFMVFASDTEVVLPQAHTASQLFGYEKDSGIELEASSGMLGLCQLFMRWLALMPNGDHMNLINPPGLTVMRIAGGRYRVTAAHRVVWTWNNEFPDDPLSPNFHKDHPHFGDLVTMTIVDVFETDCDGKLLSYCPTFDNRAVFKTDQRVERIRKSSSMIRKNIDIVAKSQTAVKVNQAATMIGKLGFKAAVTVKDTVAKKFEEERKRKSEHKSIESKSINDVIPGRNLEGGRPEHYISDDEPDETSFI